MNLDILDNTITSDGCPTTDPIIPPPTSNIWKNDYNPFNKWKVLAWYERFLAIKNNKFMAPVNVALDLIQGTGQKKACGAFKCNFCMSDFDNNGTQASIPEKIALSLPEFFSKWGVKSLCIAGHHSDPLMYKHDTLQKFLRLCKKWNLEVGFVSTGAYFTQDMLEVVAETCNWSGWSINAGKSETLTFMVGVDAFDQIIDNIKYMNDFVKRNDLKHDIGYKFLITDENHDEIIDGVQIASEIGVRHFQIRPCELPLSRSIKIDTDVVEHQIKESIALYERKDFEIFGIREKFKSDFTKKVPKRCIASPLGSTWKADGDIVICPDRRWSAHQPNMVLGNFIKEGVEIIRDEVWGGPRHAKMIEAANCNLDTCIRCTAYSWHEIYENVIEDDKMDVTLI